MRQEGCRHEALLQCFNDSLSGGGKCGRMCDLCTGTDHPVLPRRPGVPAKEADAAAEGTSRATLAGRGRKRSSGGSRGGGGKWKPKAKKRKSSKGIVPVPCWALTRVLRHLSASMPVSRCPQSLRRRDQDVRACELPASVAASAHRERMTSRVTSPPSTRASLCAHQADRVLAGSALSCDARFLSIPPCTVGLAYVCVRQAVGCHAVTVVQIDSKRRKGGV